MPTLGFPLNPRTRYAFVVTDALRSEGLGAVQASADLRRALGIDAPTGPGTEAAEAALAPAVSELAALGIAKEHIAQLAVFHDERSDGRALCDPRSPP